MLSTMSRTWCLPARAAFAASLAAAILVPAGCGREEPVVTAEPPPELRFDEATRAQVDDPRFAEFRALVRARNEAAKAYRDYGASIGGSPRTDEERARWFELFGAVGERNAAVSRALSDPAVTDDDRNVLRLIASSPD